jgi:hypothetical protein
MIDRVGDAELADPLRAYWVDMGIVFLDPGNLDRAP